MEHLKHTVEELFKFDRQLLGPGYDAALEYLNLLIPMEIKEVPSGTEFGTWTVPDEWVVKDAYVKFNGEKVIDWRKDPLSLVVYSLPFQGTVSKEELLKHLNWSDKLPDATPYVFKFYDRDWGFSVPKNMVKRLNSVEDGMSEKVRDDGTILIEETYKENWEDVLPEGDYEVFIDTEFKPGKLKYGIHTIPGKLDKEILLFAHLDHAWQANDNLSAIACLLDVKRKLKTDYTVKLVFCPETIGSQAFAYLEDLSKVEWVCAVDICGNDAPITLQKSWDTEARINRVAHCALQKAGKTFKKGKFRTSIGSDETVFNDPLIDIPGILLTTWPYDEYHTSADTPDKLNYEKIQEVADLLVSIIDIYSRDYIPVREWKGPLMRSRYGMQSTKLINLNFDYFFYNLDGEKTLAEMCAEFELPFEEMYENLEKIVNDSKASKRTPSRKEGKHKAPRKERKEVPRKTNVAGKHRKVS
jgi:aminopeptidase-like protein